MRVAFYAPLKPPDHPVPSGDRRIARLLIEALCRAGHDPFVAADFRSFDGDGDPARQTEIAERGRSLASRLIDGWRQRPEAAPGLWFTYHLYHKAPDWLGPAVAAALGIPYVVAEASYADKRAEGPWAFGHAAVERAICRADAVIGLNSADRAGVLPLLVDPARWIGLPPFLDARAFRPTRHDADGPPRLIAVAMMREGDKLASYRVVSKALAQLRDLPWSLEIVGDGAARPAVEAALAPFGARIRYAGALDDDAIADRLSAAELFLWPAINEAFGMAILEAQASGLPVVAGRSGGVADIVISDETGLLVPPGDPDAFAGALGSLLRDPARRARMGAAARDKVLREHDLPAAAARLGALLGNIARVPGAA